MWLLPVRPDHVGGRSAPGTHKTDGRGHQSRHERQYLPMRYLCPDPRCNPCRSQASGGMIMSATHLVSSRRSFLKGASAAGLGLIVGFRFDLSSRAMGAAAAPPPQGFMPNAFIHITDLVTNYCKHIEFGQWPFTGFATIIADELDASWEQIRVEHAPADVTKYANLLYKMQGTGGSTAMANSWDQLRQAGAEARAYLLQAAAAEWNVPQAELKISQGFISHPSGLTGSFGAFSERAAGMELKTPVKPKTPEQWIYIGKTFPRVDTRPKTSGDAMFTIDVKLPAMLTCVIARPPRFGGKVKSFDAGDALTVRGVVEAFAVPSGVAVLAKSYWPARKAAERLKIEWDESGTEKRSSSELIRQYKDRVQSV